MSAGTTGRPGGRDKGRGDGPDEGGPRPQAERRHDAHADRRSGRDRRQAERGMADADQRDGGERRQNVAERRQLLYSVLYKTVGGAGRVEDWLAKNCRGQWALVLHDVQWNQAWMTLRIMFETGDDKKTFMTSYGKEQE